MSNPLFSWINIADRWGTSISQLELKYNTSIFGGSPIFGSAAELLGAFIVVISSIGVLFIDLVVRQTLFLNVVSETYANLLHTAYSLVDPRWVATIALMILVARIFIGDRLTTDKQKNGSFRITGVQLESRSMFSGGAESQTFVKTVLTQVGNASLLLGVIILLMANPFALVHAVLGFVQQTASYLVSVGNGQSASGAGAVVDTSVEPLLQMLNFGGVLDPDCAQQWSQTLAGGGDFDNLSCLTDAQRSAASASSMTTISAGVGVIMMATLLWFGVELIKKASWYYVKVLWQIGSLPWRLAGVIATPGSDRKRLDTLWHAFAAAAAALAWLAGLIAIGIFVPGLVTDAVAGVTQTGFPLPLTLAAAAALYAGVAYAIRKIYGRRIMRDANGRFRVDDSDGAPTGWREWWQTNKYTSVMRETWSETRPVADGAAVAAPDTATTHSPDVLGDTADVLGDRNTNDEDDDATMTPDEKKLVDAATETLPADSQVTTTVVPVVLTKAHHSGSSVAGVVGLPSAIPRTSEPKSEQTPPAAVVDGGRSVNVAARQMAPVVSDNHAPDAGRHAKEPASTSAGPQVESSTQGSSSQYDLPGDGEDSKAAARAVLDETTTHAVRLVGEYRNALAAVSDDNDATGSPGERVGGRGDTNLVDAASATLGHEGIEPIDVDSIDDVSRAVLLAAQAHINRTAAGDADAPDFLSAERAAVSVASLRTLALALGMRPQVYIDDKAEPTIDIEVDQTSGDNVVRFGNQRGFGDVV